MTATAQRVLSAAEVGGGVAAPPETIAEIEALLPRLDGDLSVATMGEQRRLELAVGYMVDELKGRMDEFVLTQYAAAEDAVNSYFDYARVLQVLHRVREMGSEMRLLLEVMTDESPSSAANTFEFPD